MPNDQEKAPKKMTLEEEETEYWDLLKGYQDLGEMTAAKDAELYQRRQKLKEQTDLFLHGIEVEQHTNNAAKHQRELLNQRLGQMSHRIAAAKAKEAKK